MTDVTVTVSKGLILAAGDGTRMDHGTPKPALPVLGVPLLARALLSLERAGIQEAYVVLGYQAARVRRAVERIDQIGIRVHWLHNERWEAENGLSVLTAASMLNEPFVMVMSDHVIDVAVIESLMTKASGLEGIVLAVDHDISRVSDLDDATKVQLESDRIVAIGKGLDRFQAVDTGVFLASPELFDALAEAHDRGKTGLSDGVQRLAEGGRAHVVDIGDRMWQDVDTPHDVTIAERKLLSKTRKAADGPIARRFNRHVSSAISRVLVRTPITPTQISLATLFIGLVAAAAAAVGGYLPFLISGTLVQLASILDGCDGEVAQLTFRDSREGEWVDTVSDNIAYVAFLIGLTVGVHRTGLPEFYFVSGLVVLGGAILSIANILAYLSRQGEGSARAVRYAFWRNNGFFGRAMRVLQNFAKRDVMAFLVFLLALAGQLPLALPILAVIVTVFSLPITLHANLSTRRGWTGSRRHPAPEPATSPEPAIDVVGRHERVSEPLS
jgi:CDP-L-myo-inositol myo-inositolphosphotransferase